MPSQKELLEATENLLMPNYGRHLLAVVRGEGSRLWDADGKEYIDFFAGFGAGGIAGHCHPAVTEAIVRQARALTSHGNFFTNEPQIELARRIVEHGFGGKVFFCHRGAEANEAALKLVRLAAGEGRHKIISFNGCFHGRTMGGLSLTPEPFQQGFEPMLPGNVKATYGDLASVSAVADDETAGIFVEPIQGEGGINIPAVEFMQGLRRLCDERGLVLVCDEVWTAPARTGRWFAYQHYGIEPDVMTLAKAVGGGLPVGACVASAKFADVLGPGKHGCTMGGNPLCTAAAAAALKLIEDERLADRAASRGERMVAALRNANIGCVKDIRGKGLMIGVRLDEDKPAKDVMTACMDRGLLICVAKNNVVRLAPPLTTEDALLDRGLAILMEVLK